MPQQVGDVLQLCSLFMHTGAQHLRFLDAPTSVNKGRPSFIRGPSASYSSRRVSFVARALVASPHLDGLVLYPGLALWV